MDRTCEHCGKTFSVLPSKVARGGGKFCSMACRRLASRNRIVLVCHACGASFEVTKSHARHYNAKYCSVDCRDEARRRTSERPCKYCGKPILVTPYQIENGRGKYCSKHCRAADRTGERSANWRGGISFEPYCDRFNDSLKEYIRNKFNRKCVICGSQHTRRNLSVHHIDYNKMQGCVGRTWSLVPLDDGCHSKTNYNRWYWFNLLINYWAVRPDTTLDCYPFCTLCIESAYQGV